MVQDPTIFRLIMSERSGPIRDVFNNVSEQFATIRRRVGESTTKKLDSMYGNILSSPATVVILLVIIAAFFAQQGMAFQDQIDDDVEIFLPDGAPSTELLLEVREEWSTDITVIYIQSNNADPKLDENGQPMWVQGEDNITDKAILEEISWVEGDDRNIGGFAVSTQTLWISSKISEGGNFCSSTSTFSCDDLLGNSDLNVDPLFGLSWGLIGMATFALLLFIVLVLKQDHNHPLSERFVSMGLLTTGIGILVIGLLVSYEIQEEKICLYCTTAHIANLAAFVGFFRLRKLHENRDEWNK